MGFIKKIYKHIKRPAKIFGRVPVVSIVFLVVFIIFSTVLLSDRIFSQTTLSDCDASSALNTTFPPNQCNPVACSSLGSNAKNPDNTSGYNCYYAPLGTPLPPCKTFDGTEQPRVNCADIIDLPLCSIIDPPDEALSGVNCVKLAQNKPDPDPNASPPNIRGVDYAINNKDSIRFCGSVESCGAVETCSVPAMENANNCTKIKCHQMTASQTPDKNSNCDIIGCDLLTIDELRVDNRFRGDDSKQYCDGSAIKCYDLFNNNAPSELNTDNNNSDNLKYFIYRPNNPMCQIHDCPPISALCGADDTLVFQSKGDTYTADYKRYINATMPIESGLCKPINCQPVITRQYACSRSVDCSSVVNEVHRECTNEDSTIPNSECDGGCSGGYCNKEVDCNIAANNGEPECVASDPGSIDTSTDLFNAWFYRPTPPPITVKSDGNIRSGVGNNLCYANWEKVKAMGWGNATSIGIPFTPIRVDLFTHTLRDGVRSPGLCSTSNIGFRGLGYGYLCGNNLNLYSNPTKDFGYIKNVNVDYELQYPEYKITACLRYNNAISPGVCGTRECNFNIAKIEDLGLESQSCGYDVCREMMISKENIDRCSMKNYNQIFEEYSRPDDARCISETIDGMFAVYGGVGVRMRARKYGRRLCVFVDQRGVVAYDKKNFNGTEKLSDGTCIDGGLGDGGECDGKETNDSEHLANRWRTVKMINYIGNNRSDSHQGYLDLDGQFFAEQECAKIPLRVGPPRLYNVATTSNSANLFEPPLFVSNTRIVRNGPVTPEQTGSTDFHQPEIEVQYGSERQIMSLGNGYLGEDASPENYPSSPWTKVITSSIGGLTHTADIFIKKEYSEDLTQPLLCLYRRVNDELGNPLDPIKSTCVNRNKPEIRSDILGDRSAKMKVLITPDVGNVFNDAKIKLRLIADYGANDQNDSCNVDDICSNELVLSPDVESCSQDIEAYKFCSKRDYCSKLLYECIDNEIAINNALALGEPTGAFDIIKRECNTTILSNCNRKFGIADSGTADFLSQIDYSIIANLDYQDLFSLFDDTTKDRVVDNTRYGWFNEMCIVEGFEDKLKNIIAAETADGVLGKCQIDTVKSLYLKDEDSSTNCDAGGKAPYCVCSESIPGTTSPTAEQEVRKETPREAGLCIDIPLPTFCPAINYGTDDDIEASISNSYLSDAYDDVSRIHTSHQARSLNSLDSHHGEYSPILGGSNNVAGVCKGFWKPYTNSGNEILLPRLNCKIDGQWERVVGNECVRHSCPEIFTEFSNSTNSYSNHYDDAGDGGLNHGYAFWHRTPKTSDFLGDQESAYGCITGFEPDPDNGLPKRYCNQVGVWDPAINPCQGITCEAQFRGDGALAIYPTTDPEWEAWVNNGGAEFPATNASRSAATITPGSIGYGTCNNDLGFFKLSTSNSPSKTCDHFGDWSTTVINPCVTLNCNEVGAEDARDEDDGFALWPETTHVPAVLGGFVDVQTTGCAPGDPSIPNSVDWAPNPYATDPDTGQQLWPTRHCASVPIDIDIDTIEEWGTVWEAPINKCINKCQGADIDSIHGVTSERTSDGFETIRWDSVGFGEYDYQNGGSCSDMDASLFTQDRDNGCYQLRRLCGDGINGFRKGEWGLAEPMCVANNGRNGDAFYSDSDPSTTGSIDAIAAADTIALTNETSTGVCIPNYYNNGAAPARQCLYKDSSHNIDQVYLVLANGTQDCAAKCSITSGQTFGINAYNKYSGSTRTDIAINEVISLTHITDRNCRDDSNQATITCQLDGENPILTNLQNPYIRDCKKCDVSNGYISNPSGFSCGDCNVYFMRNRIHLIHPLLFPLPHGSNWNWTGSWGCSGNWRMNARCIDGVTHVSNGSCS